MSVCFTTLFVSELSQHQALLSYSRSYRITMASFKEAVLAAEAANTISAFVAQEQVRTFSDLKHALYQPSTTTHNQNATGSSHSTSVIVLCASAVLSTAETVMSAVTELSKTTGL
jgi:hypothetical protein